ncbi:MAG: hypothetical protein RSB91_04540 [Clostridia bacterium]
MNKHKTHPLKSAFGLLLRSVLRDGMLAASLLAPILCGIGFRFGVPLLIRQFPALAALEEYKALLDALLYLLAPFMALFAACMVTLEERDNGLCVALFTTPLGHVGYVNSRFVLPALLAAAYAAVIGTLFASVQRPLGHALLLALPAACVAFAAVMPIPAFARDRITGMALAKLCGLALFTVAAPFFMPVRWQPLLSWLPSYWFYRFLQRSDWLMAVLCALAAALWSWPMLRRFAKRAAR